ncbi:N-acetyltransferase eso1 [Sorochytrium milnesiophthora]
MCPEIVFVHVPTYSNDCPDEPKYHENPRVDTHKASLEPYRRASKKIMDIIERFAPKFERASIDEAYLDLTEAVVERIKASPPSDEHPVCEWDRQDLGTLFEPSEEQLAVAATLQHINSDDAWGDYMLFVAADITQDIRKAIFEELQYTCSAGIAQNKTLAKLTIMRSSAVGPFMSTMPFTKIRFLGGKLGTEVENKLNVETAGDLWKYSVRELQQHFDEATALWLSNICRGICTAEVVNRTAANSMMAAKSLRPPISVLPAYSPYVTRSCPFPPRSTSALSPDAIAQQALRMFNSVVNPFPCNHISLRCSNFEKLQGGEGLLTWVVKGDDAPTAKQALVEQDSTQPPPPSESALVTPERAPESPAQQRGGAWRLLEKAKADKESQRELQQRRKRHRESAGLGAFQLLSEGKRGKSGTQTRLVPDMFNKRQKLTSSSDLDDDVPCDSNSVCAKCSMAVRRDAMQEHMDWHFAVELSEQTI